MVLFILGVRSMINNSGPPENPTPPPIPPAPEPELAVVRQVAGDLTRMDYVVAPAFMLDILALDLLAAGSLTLPPELASKLKYLIFGQSRDRIRDLLVGNVETELGKQAILEAVRRRLQNIIDGKGGY